MGDVSQDRVLFQNGDAVEWSDEEPEQKRALERDFGVGPFTILGSELASDGGQFVSLSKTDKGQILAWIDHRQCWESPVCDTPGRYKAIPPTFHSDWLKKISS